MQNQEPWQPMKLPLAPTNTITPWCQGPTQLTIILKLPIKHVVIPPQDPFSFHTTLDDPSNPKIGFLVPTSVRPWDGSLKRPLRFLTVTALGPFVFNAIPFTLHMLRYMSIMPPPTLIRSIHTVTHSSHPHAHDDTRVLLYWTQEYTPPKKMPSLNCRVLGSGSIVLCLRCRWVPERKESGIKTWQSGRASCSSIGLLVGNHSLRKRNRVRETFELTWLKSTPSQLLLVFSGFYWLQTCCRSFGPANILYFSSSAGYFLLHFNDNRPRTSALVSKLVFQCSKIMKCNNEAKASPVRHSPKRYKHATDIEPNPRTKSYPALDELNRMKSAYFTIHPGQNPPPQNDCRLKSVFLFFLNKIK